VARPAVLNAANEVAPLPLAAIGFWISRWFVDAPRPAGGRIAGRYYRADAAARRHAAAIPSLPLMILPRLEFQARSAVVSPAFW
jgi:hypothetical protein